ncbi:ABC transporter ATP-binding protein [Actinomadura fulvescens]|uniref:ABC transporter ATP-binding protein n=1 Tax=Actinomadura fulvescens TaxID=46160 RepID=A0ABN3PX64_9ACTN
MLEAREVGLSFGQDTALVGASLAVREGESVAIKGPSGSGKSSLLHCLAGILRPSSGSVWFRGRRIDDLPDEESSELRRTAFGFVLQFGDLVPELTLVENVSLPLVFGGIRRREAEAQALNLLDTLSIADLARRRPAEVSGGQMQRTAIARALVHKPAVVFADEPTGALDSESAERVLVLLIDAVKRHGSSLVVVTHDSEVAASADRIVEVRDGMIGSATDG